MNLSRGNLPRYGRSITGGGGAVEEGRVIGADAVTVEVDRWALDAVVVVVVVVVEVVVVVVIFLVDDDDDGRFGRRELDASVLTPGLCPSLR